MPNKAVTQAHANKNALFITLSFSAIFILVFIALAVAIQQISSTNAEINEIVSINNTKTRLLVSMQIAARERTLTLYRMVNQRDPFDRDDTFMEFRNYARVFIEARHNFMAMPLSETEKRLIKRQGQLSRETGALQYQITELLYQEHFTAAAELLIKKTIPAQNNVLAEIDKLITFQNFNNNQIIKELNTNLQKNIVTISSIGGIVLLLTISIAFFGIRYISRTEKKLFLEKELAQTTLHSIGDGVITVDKNNIIQTINPVAEKLTGLKSQQVLGQDILTLYHHNNNDEKHKVSQMLAQTQRSLFDISLTQADHSKHQVEHTIAPIIDENKKTQGAVIVLRDVTKVRSLEKRLSYQASHDTLTGLINRREFEVRLNQMMRNAQIEHTEHSICFLDLDKFKIINDTAGHAAGDEFLKQVSSIIQSSLRKADMLARLGGDEFAILLDNCSLSDGEELCKQIIKKTNEMDFYWEDNIFKVGISIGIASITQHTTSMKDLMQSVDAACYKAKNSGRNQVQIFQQDNAATG